jgi:signal transduction histidine kinase
MSLNENNSLNVSWSWLRNLLKIIDDYDSSENVVNRIEQSFKDYLNFSQVQVFILDENQMLMLTEEHSSLSKLSDQDFFDRNLIESVLHKKSPNKRSAVEVTFPLECRNQVLGLIYFKANFDLNEAEVDLLYAFVDQLSAKIYELQFNFSKNKLINQTKIKTISETIFNNLRSFLEASLIKLKSLEQRNLELAELNEFKADLINNVSHELRTPLVGILGFSNILQRPNLDPELIKEASDQISAASNRLSRMIDDMLQLNRANYSGWQVHFEEVKLCDLVDLALKGLKAHSDIHNIVVDIDHDLPNIKTDRKLLLQVIENLITNAIKYSPDGGTITVKADFDNNNSYLQVVDEGIGMSAEDTSQIFDRFYRVKNKLTRKVHGLGLGLAICKDLMTALDGDIFCTSVLDKGSCFTIQLNRA